MAEAPKSAFAELYESGSPFSAASLCRATNRSYDECNTTYIMLHSDRGLRVSRRPSMARGIRNILCHARAAPPRAETALYCYDEGGSPSVSDNVGGDFPGWRRCQLRPEVARSGRPRGESHSLGLLAGRGKAAQTPTSRGPVRLGLGPLAGSLRPGLRERSSPASRVMRVRPSAEPFAVSCTPQPRHSRRVACV